MQIVKVLDIDLDFFLDKIHRGRTTLDKRLSSKKYKPWTKEKVTDFLESQCNLSKEKKVKGAYFDRHDELFHYLKKLQEESEYQLSFSIDHVDGHADLGLGRGERSHEFILRKLLFKPKESRYIGIEKKITEGNFLAFLIACQWVTDVNYINHKDEHTDLMYYYFKGLSYESQIVEMKAYDAYDYDAMTSHRLGDVTEAIPDPEVPFNLVSYESFNVRYNYDLMFLTQSPEYTPLESDELIQVIREYIDETGNTPSSENADIEQSLDDSKED